MAKHVTPKRIRKGFSITPAADALLKKLLLSRGLTSESNLIESLIREAAKRDKID